MKKIQLTHSQTAVVCDCHYDMVKKYTWYSIWHPRKNQYFAARATSRMEQLFGSPSTLSMHAQINNTPKGFETDHIDNNSLNNQCNNLRTASRSQNLHNRGKLKHNTSGFKGVYRSAGTKNKWRARIVVNHKSINIGVYETAEQAAKAYDEAARKYLGDFANTNFK